MVSADEPVRRPGPLDLFEPAIGPTNAPFERDPNVRSDSRAHRCADADGTSGPAGEAGTKDWLVWQLADSSFPTGGFAHSAGLEAAWHHGELRDTRQLDGWVRASLVQAGYGALPGALATHDRPESLAEVDELCEAVTTNHVARRASQLQGRALLLAFNRIFRRPRPRMTLEVDAALACSPPRRQAPLATPVGHWAPVFGVVIRTLELPRDTAVRLFLFNHLRSVLTAALRLNLVGPLQAQAMQYELSPFAQRVGERCALLTLDDLAQTAPLADLWQGAHDRLGSHLFQS